MLARLRPLAAEAGITRLGDLTGMDRIGLPVFQAVRPTSRSLAVSLGKGIDRRVAQLSALVESVELHRAEQIRPMDVMRPANRREGAIWSRVPPAHDRPEPFDPARPRNWLPALDLVDGGAIAAPLDAVSMDVTRAVAPDIWQNSNGLASGSDRDEALVAALLELLEREAQVRWLRLSCGERRATRLAIDKVCDGRVRAVLDRIDRAGLRLLAWDIGGPTGVPAYYCALIDPGPRMAVDIPPGIGTACDPDPATALLAAIGEAAQARIMFIAGARDDLSVDDYRDPAGQRLALAQEMLAFEPDGERAWSAEPAWRGRDNRALRGWLVARCVAAGALSLPCVTIADARTGLATIKLFAPGFGDDDRPSRFR